MKIVKGTEHESPRKDNKSFVTKLIERAGDDYYSLERAGSLLGVKKPALRAAIKRKDLPYSVLVHGGTEIILLNELELSVTAHSYGEPAVSNVYSHFVKKYADKKEKVPADLVRTLNK